MKDRFTENLAMMFEKNAEIFSDKTALFFLDKKISYEELCQMSGGLSQGLKNLGIKKKDKVALFLHNCPEFIRIPAQNLL
jgi:long-chain acyl-CoA synthetase